MKSTWEELSSDEEAPINDTTQPMSASWATKHISREQLHTMVRHIQVHTMVLHMIFNIACATYFTVATKIAQGSDGWSFMVYVWVYIIAVLIQMGTASLAWGYDEPKKFHMAVAVSDVFYIVGVLFTLGNFPCPAYTVAFFICFIIPSLMMLCAGCICTEH